MSEIKIVYNCETKTTSYLPMSAAEIAQRALDAETAAAEQEARAQAVAALETLKASARAKLEAGTPLTEEEAAVLVP